ncbi:conserved hypothetical protein [Moraxellaceae bacterium 17A]|nr:conserved hypothetical protein [Moraxellaceae bacterium 17A]
MCLEFWWLFTQYSLLDHYTSYILGYYSQVRPHSFNIYLTPVEKEKQFFNQNLLKAV